MTLFEEEERPKTLVQWTLGNQCNYKCSYCHEFFHGGNNPFPSEELVAEVCKDIVYHYDELGRDVVFEFIGGEPTLSGDIKEIGKRLHNHPTNIVLKTNGSADLEWWSESKKYLTDVVISVHKEFCDLSHIDSVITLLQENEEIHPINVTVLIPVTHLPGHWNWGIQTLKHYKTKFNLGSLQLLYSNFARGSNLYYPYSDEQWKQYSQLNGSDIPRSAIEKIEPVVQQVTNIQDGPPPIDLKIRDPLDFNGARCYAGVDTLAIDASGRVWRGWCSYGGPIGSIYELPIQFPTEPIVCGKSHCGNGFDHQARKER